MRLIDNPKGNYRFLTGIAPYSSGVAAVKGFEIVRARFLKPLPYRQGFKCIESHLANMGRPRHALCAIELRSPRALSFEGFANLNRDYLGILADWDLPVDGLNPIARTNVAPAVSVPMEAVLYGFSYTVPSRIPRITFVVAGAGELRESALTPDAVIRPGEKSPSAMKEKISFVMNQMETRLKELGGDWPGVTEVNVYTVENIYPFLETQILNRMGELGHRGVTWCYARPPILGLEYEMDMRGVLQNIWLDSNP